MKRVTLVFGIFLILVSLASAHTGNDEFDHCSGFFPMMSGNYGMGMGFFGWLTGILIIAVLVLLVIWLIKQINKK